MKIALALAATGLSLTQAQSISNLINQKAVDINNQLNAVNNSSKTVNFEGSTLTLQVAIPFTGDVVALIQEKAKLHAVQAFLMENIKGKDELLDDLRRKQFTCSVAFPEAPTFHTPKLLPGVREEWGWSQLTLAQSNEYLEQEALAAHIGQFIHSRGKLDSLRRDLANASPLEWLTVNKGTAKQEERPVQVATHHTPEQLLNLHTELAALHRNHEQRVNYFKAKVKNLVTEENARIARANADEQARVNAMNNEIRLAYQQQMQAYEGTCQQESQVFEAQRQQDIAATAALRITVDERFKPIVDEYLKLLEVAE